MFVLHKAQIYFASQNLVSEILWWLTLSGYLVPNKATLSLLSSTTQGTENIMNNSWVKIRTGRGHSSITIAGKKYLTWRNECNFYNQSN